jgi:hypothetical protein
MLSPTYPPYHKGPFLEEYFFQRWYQDPPRATRQYIDVFWTNVFCNCMFAGNPYEPVQDELNRTLDSHGSYFTVSQFDDGPFEQLPADTLIFSAGGNRTSGTIIPIPLLCSPIPQTLIPESTKTLLVSFAGSIDTHPIRRDLCAHMEGRQGVVIDAKPWRVDVSMQSVINFIELTCSSKFALAPRGYGKSSFRLYEILQLGSVPVYISDEHYLPWSDELEWSDFCVLIKPNEIPDLYTILSAISDEEYRRLLMNGQRMYEAYFSLEGMFKNIVRRIQASVSKDGRVISH